MQLVNRARNLKKFFLPPLNRFFLIRLFAVALITFILLKVVFIPLRVRHISMEPAYSNGSFVIGYRHAYKMSAPDRGDVVMIELAGTEVMYLKRVVGLPGDIVEFCAGTLVVNGEEQDEPYVRGPCDWEMEPRKVKEGYVFVVGDNRQMEISRHKFGQTPKIRIAGAPLW